MAIFINNSSLLYNDSLYPIILFPAERGNSGGAGDRKLWMKSFLLGVGTVVVHLDRKLLAKSFLLSVGTMACSWRQETIGEKFPTERGDDVVHRDRKLFAKGVPIERKDNAVYRDGPPSFSLSLVILY